MPPIIHIDETTSTSSCLKDLLLVEKLEEGTIVVTNHQTAGRGQKGTSWESAKGKNLTFSILLYPTFLPLDQQFILSKLVSLTIKEVLSEYTPNITIKWPNDIYWHEKKICGILIENSLSEGGIKNSIAGIGININQDTFESDAPNPISLKQIIGKEIDLSFLLKQVKTQLLLYYLDLMDEKAGEINEKYMSSLFRKDGFHRYADASGEFEGRIEDILPTGHLVLMAKDGYERVYAFKEVRYIIAD